jgi:hypothetical protein
MTNAPLLPSPLLRQALLADAVTTAACAALMIAGAGFLEGLLGLPATLLRAAGLLLIPFVAYVVMLGFRERVSRGAVWSVIGLNALWVVDSVLLLVSGYVAPTGSGIAFVLAQAAVVAMYAELQFMGLRRSSPALA